MYKQGGRGYLNQKSLKALGQAAMLVKLGTYKVDHAARAGGGDWLALGGREEPKLLQPKSSLQLITMWSNRPQFIELF